MNTHLIRIPSLAALTTRCLPSCDLQVLGRQTDRATDAQILRLCTLDELAADLLERLDFARGKGDADLVDFLHEPLLARFRPDVVVATGTV